MTMSFTDITSSFINQLDESRSKIDEWVSSKKMEMDREIDLLKQTENDEQNKIDDALRQLKSLRQERGVVEEGCAIGGGGVAERKKRLEEKEVELEDGISMLKTRNNAEQSQLKDILAEEAIQREKAQKVRQKKKEIEELKATKIEDLTRGLLNYRYIGLNFAKTDVSGGLIIKLTKLDPNDESRPFSFVLSLNKEQKYELSDCSPHLASAKTNELLDVLNTDLENGFNSFIVGMRKLFMNTLASC